ncbi:hypothetical protein BOX15_Mlig021109g1 [Macrostomum lignano]|uniref:PDZ domain-containing protein n=1 Tax=Macrostomum lignano TaxID=282301 RepID=A0A267F7X8_9PLAT|nr:hypothetical protein BOX15_Mlig021109g1 [Macrostomum lignano]
MSTESGQPLSVAAAVGMSVGLTVLACACITAIVICLLAKRWRPRHGITGGRVAGNHTTIANNYENQFESQSQNIRFAEEGTGTLVAARAPTQKHHSKKGQNDSHTIGVKVNAPDDLRFKVCRNSEGEILVATSPGAGSRCSRDGVSEGDRILGIYVNIKAAGASAHPKEVSELLSLASDYPLVVEFAHTGPVVPGPSVSPSDGKTVVQTSAADVVLRRHRNRQSVDVAEGPSSASGAVSLAPEQKEPIQQQRHSRKLWAAPPPPEDRDSHFSILDRRKRRKKQKPAQTASTIAEEPQPQLLFDRLCGLHSNAAIEEDEWIWTPNVRLTTVPGSSEDSHFEDDSSESDTENDVEVMIDEEKAIAVFSSFLSDQPPLSVARGKVERVFDFYELEEQDVVSDMPPPSELRPVTDCCTQYDCAEASAAAELTCWIEEARNVWESLPNHPVQAPSRKPSYKNNSHSRKDKFEETAATRMLLNTEEDEDRELVAYLRGAASDVAAGRTSTSSTSSPRTVQEEPAVAVVAESAYRRPPRREPEEAPQLVELSRSMALRDVEVATVILLDSEARQRQQLDEDDVTLSSGRSTVQEEKIDPEQAPDRLALAGVILERELENLDALVDSGAAIGYDVELDDDRDRDEADAESLNADFELAAAEWTAAHPDEDLSFDFHQDEERADATIDW